MIFSWLKRRRARQLAEKFSNTSLTAVYGVAATHPDELPGLSADDKGFVRAQVNRIDDAQISWLKETESMIRGSANPIKACREQITSLLEQSFLVGKVRSLPPQKQKEYLEKTSGASFAEILEQAAQKEISVEDCVTGVLVAFQSASYLRAVLIRSWGSVVFSDAAANDWYFAYQHYLANHDKLLESALRRALGNSEPMDSTTRLIASAQAEVRDALLNSGPGADCLSSLLESEKTGS